MLILKLNEEKKKKSLKLFRKKQKNIVHNKSSFVCQNVIFNVVELSESDLYNEEIISLLNKYKGAVLDTQNKEINDYLTSYLFNYSFYIKRAIVSSFIDFLTTSDIRDVVIYDENFKFSEEYVRLAGICRRLVIFCDENKEIIVFSKYCYNKFGLNVFINDESFVKGKSIYINLNNVIRREPIMVCDGNNNLEITAASEYFVVNPSVKKLTDFGVSHDMACAVVEVIPYKKHIFFEEKE